MTDEIRKLQQLIDDSHRIVFFGGAGVSTESGIPDFRSVDGLYHQKFAYPPETILSHSFFISHCLCNCFCNSLNLFFRIFLQLITTKRTKEYRYSDSA